MAENKPITITKFSYLCSFINDFDGSPRKYKFFVFDCERALAHIVVVIQNYNAYFLTILPHEFVLWVAAL